MSARVLEYRKFLLDFYSSELTAHARLLVGFAIILLTLMQVRLTLEIVSLLQFFIFYFSVWLAGFAFWYLLMRHLMYGQFASAAMFAPLNEKGESLRKRLNKGIEKDVSKHKVFFIFKTRWFTYGSNKKLKWGLILCGFLSFVTTLLAFLLIDFSIIAPLLQSLFGNVFP